MGQLKVLLLFALVALFAAFVADFLITVGTFETIYNHQPGKCIKYEMNGSEDMVLLPNNQVLISSGIYFWYLDGVVAKPEPGIFMFDLNHPDNGPKKLTMDQTFLDSCPDFTPHGISHWVVGADTVLLYVVNHRKDRDTIESFQYDPETLTLKHRKTFENPLFYNINDLVLVGLDEFYLTNDHYFSSHFLKKMEVYLKQAVGLGSVTYYDGETGKAKYVASSLRYPNGIAASNDKSLIYVNHLLKGEVIALRRGADNELTRIETTLPLQVAIDNTFVDPTNGHLWVAILAKPLQVEPYFSDRSVEVASRIVHVAIDEKASSPFESFQIEELFATTGDIISATTVAVYSDGKLLVGTIGKDMLYCEAPYLIY